MVFSMKTPPFPSNSLKHPYIRNSYNHLPSRRLALFQLGSVSAIPQSEFFGSIVSGKSENTATAIKEQDALNWVKNDNRRMLHVVYRVGDLEKTIKFYTECLGMKLSRKRDIPEEQYSNAFLGYGPEDSHFAVELTYINDVSKTVDLVKAKGGKVTRDPGPVKGGTKIIAFIEDPDGYTFELLEREPTPEPLCQVMLRVGDLDRSINFYKKAFGMELLRAKDNPEYKYTTAMMGFGPEDKNAVLELTYNYGVTEYDKGNGYAQIANRAPDGWFYKTRRSKLSYVGGTIIPWNPGPLAQASTLRLLLALGPRWPGNPVFVDNIDFLKELE
uniref:VOC domain-containing protein n=1 Tax=Gossypium raimondii TaxID=29730 RepID=A0A0D2V8H6_GOSRA|nr:hypothetical protein B456_010G108000 [Gossypium raimondii]